MSQVRIQQEVKWRAPRDLGQQGKTESQSGRDQQDMQKGTKESIFQQVRAQKSTNKKFETIK